MKRPTQFMLAMLFILSAPLAAQGVVVAAGGGAEGNQGDTSSWSYRLYKKLVENGDIDNDGVIRVAILSEDAGSSPSFLPDYFEWIGTTLSVTVVATNYEVNTTNKANSANTVGGVANADVVFIKGGDQGWYYDTWNGTLLETNIRAVANGGGAVGGTSAGGMSMAEYCFSGSKDMISDDVLADAKTTYLDDNNDGGSGIHTDWLSFVPNVVIETHYTERGRLGRMAGVLARAIDDHNDTGILAMGLERKTGVVIDNNEAEVIGEGSVTFLQHSSQTTMHRDAGSPLYVTDQILDRLTEGWRFDLSSKAPILSSAPSGTQSISVSLLDRSNSGALSVSGATENDMLTFGHYGTYYPSNYARTAGTADPYIKDSVGYTNITSSNRADKHETLFRLLYDEPADVGFLVYSGGTLSRDAGSADVISFSGAIASLVVDAATATRKGLSPYTSQWASSGGSLKAATLVNARLHIMADSASRGKGYNTRTHQIVNTSGGGGGGGGGGGTGIAEVESNNSRGNAQDINNESFPLTINGTLSSSSDLDYFSFTINRNETITVSLDVPAGVDYDLYLLDHRGRTVTRSINDGNGVDESLSYTHGARSRTYYVMVESYSGSTSTQYHLDIDFN